MNQALFAELVESVREGSAVLRREQEPMRTFERTPAPCIVTLKLDMAAFRRLDTLRQQHFPAERNFLSAHITLFHALPGDQEEAICATLQRQSAVTPVIPLTLPTVRFLGRGVALTVDSPALIELRRQLATPWYDWLSAQDRQRYQPHVTIQNKVLPEVARTLYDQLSQSWTPLRAQGEGLLLWRYHGGPWEAVTEFPFGRPTPLGN